MQKPAPLLSEEAAATLVVGLVVSLIPEMDWWLRAIGVFATALLAIHTGKRMAGRPVLRIVFPLFAISILCAGTLRSIWLGFHDSFPMVSEDAVLAKIIEVSSVASTVTAGYFFILRPRSLGKYKVLPAQVIAFGMTMIAVGLVTAGFGLAWQFRQNWISGITPAGGPTFSLVPPRIQQAATLPALPPPNPVAPTAFFSSYNLTEAGVVALAAEFYKIKNLLSKQFEIGRMGTDQSSSGLVVNIEKACDRAGLDCPIQSIHPNSPDEKGLMIYVLSPKSPPEAAFRLKESLLNIGLNVPIVGRPDLDPTKTILFVGPSP